MFDTIRKKLFFYSPLVMCVFIWFSLYFTNPDLLRQYALPLFVMYMIMRFFWRRHLKNTDQYKGNSFGAWGLFFGAVLIMLLLSSLVPQEEVLVTYQTKEQIADKEREREAVNYKTSDYMNSFFDQLLVCGYLAQEGELTECKVMTTVEIDNNPETYEIFALTKRVRDCVEKPCQLFLAQMTKEAMSAARAHQTENPPPVEGKMINSWQVTDPVAQINQERHNGWNTFELTVGGTRYVWEYDKDKETYVAR
ncbi:hypothetical protein EOL70_25550 [Leucothrix sargassi]|nr:hypothetical protein EOL70_25550 [Leucothrix sargassi]